MNNEELKAIAERLDRLVRLVERSVPSEAVPADFAAADAFVWHAERKSLEALARVNRIDLGLLRGIDRQRDILLQNTARFARGLPANNVLLWGARGMGKSSLIKAVHAAVNGNGAGRL